MSGVQATSASWYLIVLELPTLRNHRATKPRFAQDCYRAHNDVIRVKTHARRQQVRHGIGEAGLHRGGEEEGWGPCSDFVPVATESQVCRFELEGVSTYTLIHAGPWPHLHRGLRKGCDKRRGDAALVCDASHPWVLPLVLFAAVVRNETGVCRTLNVLIHFITTCHVARNTLGLFRRNAANQGLAWNCWHGR